MVPRRISGRWPNIAVESDKAGVAELADATDSKSVPGNRVWVRVPPPALPCLGLHHVAQIRLSSQRHYVCDDQFDTLVHDLYR